MENFDSLDLYAMSVEELCELKERLGELKSDLVQLEQVEDELAIRGE